MDMFTVTQPLPDVYHIQDSTGVCFTLITGERDSLLWDTGVGLYDVAAYIQPYIRGKLTVVLSHAHYDHACGQHYFPKAYVHPVDLLLCKRFVGKTGRRAIFGRLQAMGLVPDNYPVEQFLDGTPRHILPLADMTLDLGGLDVQFLLTPGHTAGSIVAYIPGKRLLLTGDMWNPHTWLFFRESQALAVYAQSMKALYDLEVDHVLCPHDNAIRNMVRFRSYIDGLNEQTFSSAQPCPVPPYTRIHTYCCYPEPASKLVFNGDKRE